MLEVCRRLRCYPTKPPKIGRVWLDRRYLGVSIFSWSVKPKRHVCWSIRICYARCLSLWYTPYFSKNNNINKTLTNLTTPNFEVAQKKVENTLLNGLKFLYIFFVFLIQLNIQDYFWVNVSLNFLFFELPFHPEKAQNRFRDFPISFYVKLSETYFFMAVQNFWLPILNNLNSSNYVWTL